MKLSILFLIWITQCFAYDSFIGNVTLQNGQNVCFNSTSANMITITTYSIDTTYVNLMKDEINYYSLVSDVNGQVDFNQEVEAGNWFVCIFPSLDNKIVNQTIEYSIYFDLINQEDCSVNYLYIIFVFIFLCILFLIVCLSIGLCFIRNKKGVQPVIENMYYPIYSNGYAV